jgi:competence protein ComEC
LAAWLGSIPLVAYYFHIVTPISALANMLAVPLCVLVLAANLISLLLAGWFPLGAALFNHIGWLLMDWIHETSVWFANWPYAYRYVAMPSLFAIIVYYVILLAIFTGWLFKAKFRTWRIAGTAVLLAGALGQWLYEGSAAHLTALSLNGGSAIYCDPPGAQNGLLIDCGNNGSMMKLYLCAQGVNSLPRVALTHGDERQIGGFEALQALMPIEKVITSSVHFRSPKYRQIIDSLEATPGRRQVVSCGDSFANWTVLHPDPTNHFARADDNALALCGNLQGIRILLLSDLGRAGQEALLERNADLHADIVIAGLPEQSEPLNNALLDAIRPELIVITDSELPSTRKASHTLRERLAQHNIPVIYTSDSGAVNISLRQNRWEATTVDGPRWSGAVSPAATLDKARNQ